MKDISDKILQKIKEKRIKPRPKWQFMAERVLLWSSAILVTIIGSMAVSALIHRVATQDWDIHQYLGRGRLQHILLSLPYLWIGLVCLFIVLAYYNVRETKSGYKYKAYWIVIGSIIVSLFLGTVLYSAKVGKGIDSLLSGKLPPFLQTKQEEIWENPDKGLLGGEVIAREGEVLAVKDFTGEVWAIDIQAVEIPLSLEIKAGDKVKLVGKKTDEHNFQAYAIRFWGQGPFGEFKGFAPHYPKIKGWMIERKPF